MTQVDHCSMCRHPLPIDAPMRLCPSCLLEGALFDEPISPDEETADDLDGLFGSDFARKRADLPRTDPEHAGAFSSEQCYSGQTASQEETRLWIPPKRTSSFRELPNYEIRGVLGRGGMGIVYLALQIGANRLVALKMMRAGFHLHREQLQRFASEIRSVASLRHPNVVQIFEVGEVGGRPYFSLELLEGGTLKSRLASASLSPRVAAETLLPIARAIAAAHEAGIIHRDLKPSNVLFDLDGKPKVADFGLAKRLEADDEGHTEPGQVVGTPCYMAPEQARGDNHAVCEPADVYSLGAILYEMLVGRPPFKGATSSETIQMVISQEPVPPTRCLPKLPRDLETICLKCLEKEPSKRYPNASELADDLKRFLANESILARPTPAWERAVKWSKRKPTQAAGLSAGLVGTIILIFFAAWSIEQSRLVADRIAKKRLEVSLNLQDGLAQRARGDLSESRTIFKTLLADLGDEPDLADLTRRVRADLDEVEARIDEKAVRAGDSQKLAEFRTRCDEALLRDGHAAMSPRGASRDLSAGDEAEFLELASRDGTGSPVLRLRGDPSRPLLPRLEGHPGLVRRDALKALEVFGTREGGRIVAMALLPNSFNEVERAEVEAGRYLMLMVLSDAVSRPLPGENPRRQAEEALALLDQASKRPTSSPALHLRRASCFDRLGDPEAARLEREKAAKAGPADAFDHLVLGQESSRRGDWDTARIHFEAALRTRDDLFWAHCLLAIAQINGAPSLAEAARVRLSRCISRQPTYGWLYMLRGYANGRSGWALAPNRAGADTASPSIEAQGRFEEAEGDFREALRLGLDDELTYALLINRGIIRFHRGRLAEAEDDFQRAIYLDEGRYNAHAAMAQVLRRQDRRSEAIDRLDRAITLEPRIAALYRGRALSRLDRGDKGPTETKDKEKAALDLETSAHLEPPGSLAAAGDHIVRSHLLLGMERAADAVVAADAALLIAPKLATAHVMRVAALIELRQYDRAAESCDVALAGGRATPDLYRFRGLSRVGKKDFPNAIDDFSRALSLHPGDPTGLLRHRGWAYLFAQAPLPALGDFDAVLDHDKSDPDGLAGRAAALVRLGRYREAVIDARESLHRTGPSDQHEYNAAQVFAQAAALVDAGRTRTIPSRDSLDYEKQAADLLAKLLERKPAEARLAFWNESIVRDPLLKVVLHNPLVKQRLQAIVLSAR